MNFPQFRKYKNIKTYFKIISEKEFEEVSAIGSNYSLHKVIAEQYPEMLRIQDMLNCENDAWEIIEFSEYLRVKSKC